MKNYILKTFSALAIAGLLATACSSTKEGTSTSDSTITTTDSAGMSGTTVQDTTVRDSM